jgi:hypothetical protein
MDRKGKMKGLQSHRDCHVIANVAKQSGRFLIASPLHTSQ